MPGKWLIGTERGTGVPGGSSRGQRLSTPAKAGEVLWMKVPYGEGLASHTGSESYGCTRKDAVEALTGVRAGWVWSPEIDASGVPTRFKPSEGHTDHSP